jgi:phosphatidylinositol kinase/protein kinase (PI-3  family)
MKTTKFTALAKRIEKLVSSKEISKNSLVYRWVSDLKSNEILRPVFSQGSTWKHSSLIDKTNELTVVLRKLGVEYVTGNDAVRGGKTGYFVKITTKIN